VKRRAIGAGLLAASVIGGLLVSYFWSGLFEANLHAVVRGEVYRSGQPDPTQLGSWIDQLGIRTVVSFRRYDRDAQELISEREACRVRGVEFQNFGLSGDRMPTPATLSQLVELLDDLERPLLLHCSGGVERSGLGAALVLLLDGAAPATADDQFSARYGYFPWQARSELPLIVEDYRSWLDAHALEHGAERFRSWVRKDYVPGSYRAELEVLDLPEDPRSLERHAITVRATNRSPRPWRFSEDREGGIRLAIQQTSGRGLDRRGPTKKSGYRDAIVGPGESIEIRTLLYPFIRPGPHRLLIDLFEDDVGFFRELGSTPLVVNLDVRPRFDLSDVGAAPASR
jgi:protein tyrosine phosphatase (PTP) superfamily phosphohydrolase (DUF442 family)